MSEMVEKVARALFEFNAEWVPSLGAWEDLWSDDRDLYVGLARAAIEAMREATEAMVRAANLLTTQREGRAAIYQAMIDEALR